MKDQDIDRRHAQTLGAGPRIEPLAGKDIDAVSLKRIIDVRAGAGAGPMGEIPEYMRTVARHPELFAAHMDMGKVLFGGRIPPRERELAVLRIGWRTQAPYEWGQHVAIAYRVGITAEEIERVIEGPGATGWSEHEAAVIRGVDELLADAVLSDATWDTLAASWDEPQLIEYPMLVGQYVATAYLQNTLRIRLEGGSAGLRTR